jgi:DNA-directed RNA polymerase subunit RPC12/RpoP
MIDGVLHHYDFYNCNECGRKYDVERYTEYKDNSCEYTEYRIIYSYDQDGNVTSSTSTNEGENHGMIYHFESTDEGIVRTASCNCGTSNFEDLRAVVKMNAPDQYDVVFIEENNTVYFVFAVKVAHSNRYVFYSDNNSTDTYGYIYDADGKLMYSDDDGGDGSNFRIEANLVGGETYYLVSCFYGERSDHNSNNFTEGYYDLYFDHYSI